MDRAACFAVSKYSQNLLSDFIDDNHGHLDDVGRQGDKRAAGFREGFVPELFYRLNAEAPVAVEPSPAAALRAKLHAMASDVAEFGTLRKQTVRNAQWAGIAATEIAEKIVDALPARSSSPDADKARSMLEGLQAFADESPAAATAYAGHVARAEGLAAGAEFATLEQAASLNETAMRNAIRAGIAAASESIDAAESTLQAFGYGGAFGTPAHADQGVALELARRVASSSTLKRIVELAGRLQMTARAKRASRCEYSRSEVVGVEQTAQITRVLPSEMVALCDATMTAALYRKCLERSALGYKMAGKEREAKGPIVILIDQSYSMNGDKDIWAKAVALALLDAARADNRAFGIVLYNGGIIEATLFPSAVDADPRALLDLLSSAPHGDTEFSAPMTKALDWIQTANAFGKADIVHITDGAASTAAADMSMKRAESIGAHVYGIAIGEMHPALKAWSHEVVSITDVSADSAAVDLIFDNL